MVKYSKSIGYQKYINYYISWFIYFFKYAIKVSLLAEVSAFWVDISGLEKGGFLNRGISNEDSRG